MLKRTILLCLSCIYLASPLNAQALQKGHHVFRNGDIVSFTKLDSLPSLDKNELGFWDLSQQELTNKTSRHRYKSTNDSLSIIGAVVNQNDSIEEINHYYPYGTLFGESTGLANTVQPYKYSGKELDRMHGLDMYDYGARLYDPMLGRWGQVDNRAEDYYPYTPYEYCLFNPINNIDPDGNSVWTKVLKVAAKVSKAVAKDGVKALDNAAIYTSTVEGIVNDVQTLTSSETSTTEKIVAGASILSEVLPVSVSDVKEVGKIIKRANSSEKLQQSATIGKEAHRQIEKGLKDMGLTQK